ncbi:MAG: rRNA maturation RNase YbeY [Hyphomicrobiaceae bacterium]|nr:rRNA maturation RNase YbeY [Hyphomicrobiaceae bacterium]
MNETPEALSTDPQDGGDDDPEPPERLRLDVLIEDGDWSAFAPVEETVEAAAGALARRLDLSAAEAAVALSSDARVRALNLAYRGKDKPTNVLSFPAARGGMPAGPRRHLGDLALAAETVAREAAAEGKPPRHHLQHLVVHGLLHLLGYEHECEPQALEMEGLEVEILSQLGVADPYAAQASSET